MADIFDQIAANAGTPAEGTATLGDIFDQIAVAAKPEQAPLSLAEKVLGYSRSYLAGPTFGFADNIEAAIAAPFTDKTYSQELEGIRAQQNRFKDQTDYLDNAVEMASGTILNPLGSLKTLAKGAQVATNPAVQALALPGVRTAVKAVTSVPAQAAIQSIGADNGQNSLQAGLTGAAVGTALSAASSTVGKVLSDTARGSDRLKLSAYGIGSADIAKQIKKMDAFGGKISDASEVPLLKTLKSAEAKGLVDAGADVLENAASIGAKQDELSKSISSLLTEADAVVPSSKVFPLTNTQRFIDGLSGKARTSAEKAAKEELEALAGQMERGSIKELQKLKVGLNYNHDASPLTSTIQKAIRSDLREAIESRVDFAARNGMIDETLSGAVKKLNSEWGNLAELRDAFIKRGYKDLQGDVIEDTLGGMRTSGGTGTANLASATTGNPLWAILGAGANAARVPENKSALADIISDPAVSKTLSGVGKALPEVVTGKNSALMFEENQRKPNKLENLLQTIVQPAPAKEKAKNTANLKPISAVDNDMAFINTMFKGDDMSQPTAQMIEEANPVAADLVKAVVLQESAGNPNAVSSAGAQGLMQLMPATGREWHKKLNLPGEYDPFDADQNKAIGTAYLAYLLNMYNGDQELALTAYNQGFGRVNRLLDKTGGKSLSDIIDLLGPDGRGYAKGVLSKLDRLRNNGQVEA